MTSDMFYANFDLHDGDSRLAAYPSPLGQILIAGRQEAVTGLWFADQRHLPDNLPPWDREAPLPVLRMAVEWLDLYFSGREPSPTPPLAPFGTAFRRQVWAMLRAVPYGQTVSYGMLAEKLAAETGKAVSARAVGGAVGHNPISLMIPCHRVVGADGSLVGYAGGLMRKRFLLDLEGSFAARP